MRALHYRPHKGDGMCYGLPQRAYTTDIDKVTCPKCLGYVLLSIAITTYHLEKAEKSRARQRALRKTTELARGGAHRMLDGRTWPMFP